jgi:hypothetical protein
MLLLNILQRKEKVIMTKDAHLPMIYYYITLSRAAVAFTSEVRMAAILLVAEHYEVER